LASPLTPPPGSRSRDAACPATAAQAHAWLDGELPAGAAAVLDAHVRACGPCRAHVAALRRLLAVLRRQRAHQPPAPATLRARARELAARWHQRDAGAVDAASAAPAAAPAALPAPASAPASASADACAGARADACAEACADAPTPGAAGDASSVVTVPGLDRAPGRVLH
jgi:anti-sigma factor RsiW